jgi:hypothetical protein
MRRIVGVVGGVAARVGRAVGLVALDDVGAARIVARRRDDVGEARARFGDGAGLGDVAAAVVGQIDVIALGRGRAGQPPARIVGVAGRMVQRQSGRAWPCVNYLLEISEVLTLQLRT